MQAKVQIMKIMNKNQQSISLQMSSIETRISVGLKYMSMVLQENELILFNMVMI
jgi:hypothetical protein